MNRVLILPALLALTGLCATASVVSLGTFAVNPQNSFLYESSNDSDLTAVLINLSNLCVGGSPTGCVTVTGGTTTLQIIGLGSLCFVNGSDCQSETLGGVFDTNNTVLAATSLAPGNTNRLTGVVPVAGLVAGSIVNHNPFLNTYYGNVDTTVAGDFFIPTVNGITVVVPTGAQYLVVGVLDSFFADNSFNGANPLGFQINEITPASVPEPATFGLFAAGLAGFVAFRRSRYR